MKQIGWALLVVLALGGNIEPTALAAERPAEVISVERGSCGWREGFKVTFDTEEVVMVSYTSITKPFVGSVASFWRAFVSLSWPFWHSAGFTQVRADGTHTGRILFMEC